ncbi:hypothetical protein [Paraburkholderia sp. BL9I2N2]|uniref:hypothetical protein n=1 Tax=Paraburkholderia sp. BL9I2N2 TaxID=1938809 RepID=UPI0010539F7E|nr:hypothetical protein [Paraburkholderia sp. BL9I2N2]TCK96562.1 hypothetical protein B0G74_3247 [Paraburkholderia sp. BL9I2N2]
MNEGEPLRISQQKVTYLTTDDKCGKNMVNQIAAVNLELSDQDVVIDSAASAVKQIAEDTKASVTRGTSVLPQDGSSVGLPRRGSLC